MSIESTPPVDGGPETAKIIASLPRNALTASAARITSEKIGGRGSVGYSPNRASWQDDAWEMYDLVGEQRFLAATLAGRLAQARLYVGRLGDDPTADPEKVDDPRALAALSALGDPRGLLLRFGVNLFIAGDSWLVGIPTGLLPASQRPIEASESRSIRDEGTTLDDLQWRVLSLAEVSWQGSSGEITLLLGAGADEKIATTVDDVWLIRVWRSHPRRSWEADSPTRSSLPVLRELVGLTMQISAQIDSRLAGAGLLLIPQTAAQAIKASQGISSDNQAEDPFTEALIEAMVTPIQDRASASAVVPLTVTVPDDTTNKFQHMGFGQPIDEAARELRDEAIRRLALGQDAPPELLLGVGGMNHWGAWLVREDVVTTHIEPPLAIICQAITEQYLRPVLVEMGYSVDEAKNLVVHYDVSHMIVRPNRAADALSLYNLGVLSDSSLREATGFDDTDGPAHDDTDSAVLAALDLVKAAPSLVANPGLPAVVEQIRAVMEGRLSDAERIAEETTSGIKVTRSSGGGAAGGSGEAESTRENDGPPATSEAPPAIAASAGTASMKIRRPSRPSVDDDNADDIEAPGDDD